MPPTVMVLGIVLIVMIANVLKARASAGAKPQQADAAETARLRGEVQQLKERIQVLERVVTDNHASVDLDREIARLRDR